MKRGHKYIITEDGQIRPESNVIKWAIWFESSCEQRFVAETAVSKMKVHTCFTGVDHNFGQKGQPILWETYVFWEGPNAGNLLRCSGNREQAEAMHNKMVERCKTSV